ncbi:MAG: MaoC family dehydratase N-terminal domain-containing protein [Phycisphaeraceae bacterium]|nr:MaoC family dehydratase N-terminal domain-containing protein [Phycisphaeraceae bacterium]
MSSGAFYEDLVVGDSFITTGRTITEADLVIHAGHTGDFYPHHMDAEFAKSTPYGARIAHGTLTFAVAVGMKSMNINPNTMTYGFDHLRFPGAVRIGDTIRVKVTISKVEDHPKNPGVGRFSEHVEVLNQRSETVMVFEHIGLITRRHPQKS